jgi:mono/diheme cytochrome c family protein
MKMKIALLIGVLATALGGWGVAASGKKDGIAAPATRNAAAADAMRVEGERRFRSNCGRCHTAPQKFPPRMMGTIVRHMRVRATITDEDMKLVLYYMTQ